jgi:hypothetical protein
MKHGNAIFFEYGTCGHKREWRDDPALFQRWKEGRTGMPLVDANMRELAATGARPNAGRGGKAELLLCMSGGSVVAQCVGCLRVGCLQVVRNKGLVESRARSVPGAMTKRPVAGLAGLR